MKPRSLLLVAAVLGGAGIVIGAFGAHALPSMLEGLTEADLLEREAWLETGVRYHMYHVPALMALALAEDRVHKASIVGWLWLIGILIFSGCLYAMSLTGIRVLGAVVPIGGLSLMAGWFVLAAKVWASRSTAT